jgi:hypothetical protein
MLIGCLCLAGSEAGANEEDSLDDLGYVGRPSLPAAPSHPQDFNKVGIFKIVNS